MPPRNFQSRSGRRDQPKDRPKARPKPAANSNTTDWGNVADWYDKHVGDDGGEFHQAVVLPGTLRLLATKPGERVLDVACGQGVLCRRLSDIGVSAVGVDLAKELIRAAKDRSVASATIEYHVADARELGPPVAPAESFDAAACVLAIQNINPIGPVMSGVAAALKPGGRFVLVMMHPCFRGPKESFWGWDPTKGVQFRRVDRYLLPRKTPIVAHPGADPDTYTWSFHKPIGAYVRALRGAGLLVDTIDEWASHKQSDSGPRAAAENAAREEIPLFLAIRAVKAGASSSEGKSSSDSEESPIEP